MGGGAGGGDGPRGAAARVALAALALLSAPARADDRCPGPTLSSGLPPPAVRPWTDATLPAEQRAELLLAQMTLEEKIDLATGERCLIYGYYDAPIERLGIPALTMTDGPAGIRIPYERVNGGRATQLPAPIALAASWDLDLAAAQGDVLGAEAFATGHNVLLGPTLDVVRDPLAGRTFEDLGEDPLLAARLAAPLVRAIQAHPVLADGKHFAVYGREGGRFTLDARLDERTLREIYLRPFAAAVQDGGVATVMCGFNRVNGAYACEDGLLLDGMLKGDLGFDGFVLSDWGAIHGTGAAALAGLDMELAFERYFGHGLLDAVRRGEVPESVVDEKARRILRAMLRFGLFDHPVAVAPLPEREHGQRSREIAEAGEVLLKNDGGLLPLDAGALRSVAVIGPDAANVSPQGGGAARVEPTYGVSPLDAIRARARGGVDVAWREGTDPVVPADLLPGPPAVPSSVLTPDSDPTAHGLDGRYWDGPSFDGDPSEVRLDRKVAASAGFFSYQSVNASSVPAVSARYALSRFSARWSGTLTAPASGDYTFTLTSRGRAWMWLDGRLVIDHSEAHDLDSRAATVHLAEGERHALRVDYAADWPAIGVATDLGGDVKLGWVVPPGTVLPAARDAAALAARADVAVVFLRDYGTEERDRPALALPGDQDALVAAVAAANPRTVVVLATGQPADMPWLPAVRAVLEAWYAGQEQGNAIARVLFGDVNPSGKLPLTFPRALADTPAAAAGDAGGADGATVRYAEGTLVGYRWYDAKGIAPLFPFGFGLSYTTFAYDGLEVIASQAGAGAAGRPGPGRVAFTVTNRGGRAGAEIAQVYVGTCPDDAGAAPQRLAGWAKVPLAAGASARVTVDLAPEALARWSPDAHAWITPACDLTVTVSASSRDPRLSGALRVGPDGAVAPVPAGASGGGCTSGGGGAVALAALLLAWALHRGAGRRARARRV